MLEQYWKTATVRGALLCLLLLPTPAMAIQLPPDIQADRYLLQVERAIREQNFQGAKTAMDAILELQEQHDLELPEEFSFKYADVLERLEIYGEAINFVTEYLTLTGRNGEFYLEALELLNAAEAAQIEARRKARAAAALARRRADEERRRAEAVVAWGGGPICAGQVEGTACWIELEGRPTFCFVWNSALRAGKSVTWSAACAGGLAQGTGTLTWVSGSGQQTSESTGRLRDGKRYGQWVLRFANGTVEEGPYVEGKRYGQWVLRFANGTVEEGPYVEGKRLGRWVFRDADGNVSEGPMVDGKQHGRWVARGADGTVAEGPMVDGKQHGRWVSRYANGNVAEGPYVEDKRHGRWVFRSANGNVEFYRFVNGEQVNK